MNTLKFTDADLKANREGRLSDAQVKRFDSEADRLQGERNYAFWSGVTILSIAVIGIVVIAALLSAIAVERHLSSVRFSAISSVEVALVVGVMIFIFLVVLSVFCFHMLGFNRKIRTLTTAPVCAAEGTAEIFYPSFENSKDAITVGNILILHLTPDTSLTFKFYTLDSLRYFQQGKRYRVYYLPYAMPQALSAEEIEPEKVKR